MASFSKIRALSYSGFALVLFLTTGTAYSQNADDSCQCETPVVSLKLCDSVNQCCVERMAEILRRELPSDTNRDADQKQNDKDPCASDYDQLVSDHTYRRYLAKGMAKVLSFDNSVNSGNRYATLSVDEDKSTFSFSPAVVRLGGHEQSSGAMSTTWGYLNTFLKGKVNSDGVAEIFSGDKWNREFTAGVSFVWLLGSGGGDFFSDCKDDPCEQIGVENFRAIQQALPDILCKKYQRIITAVQAGNEAAYIQYAEALEDCDALHEAMRKEYSDIEEKLAEPLWTLQWRHWISLAPEYGFAGFALVDTVIQNGAQERRHGAGQVRLAYNMLIQPKKWFGKPSFYLSPSITVRRRNQFSELSTQSWNKFTAFKDTSLLFTDEKDVYVFDGGTIEHKFLPTLGMQAVGIWNWKKFGIGFDISLMHEWLYTRPNTDDNRKTVQSYGIVFPFNDKEGEPTVNITLFYQRNSYKLASMETENLLGLRFAVPIFSSKDE
jgi:hypothetical protein